MVKFCPKCERLLRKKKDPTGKPFLKCPNPNCDYSESCLPQVDMQKQSISTIQKKKILATQVVVLDGSEKKQFSLPKTNIHCPKCGHNEAYYDQCQIRSTCEPSTTFFQCVRCDHRWRDDESLVLI